MCCGWKAKFCDALTSCTFSLENYYELNEKKEGQSGGWRLEAAVRASAHASEAGGCVMNLNLEPFSRILFESCLAKHQKWEIHCNFFVVKGFNTQYDCYSTCVDLVKMEPVSKITIFGLK